MWRTTHIGQRQTRKPKRKTNLDKSKVVECCLSIGSKEFVNFCFPLDKTGLQVLDYKQRPNACRPARRIIMKNYKLGDMELEFANLIWENEPISSGGLVQLCEQKFSWKKSTTYTMLKRLCDKGIFQNNSGNVVSVLSKQEWFTKQSEGFVEETFNGSLPQFLVAFTRRKKLSKQEIAEIQKIIDQNAEE